MGRKARSKGELDAATRFLELFYPVHYKIGIGIEDALRDGALSRHQVAILWLIRSEGEDGRRIRRKQIERSLSRWFEISNSAISKALRSMSRPPLELVTLVEDPRSGREKLVLLTDEGGRRINEMFRNGRTFIQTMVDHLTGEEAQEGVHFLSRVSHVIDIVQPWEARLREKRAAGGAARASRRRSS